MPHCPYRAYCTGYDHYPRVPRGQSVPGSARHALATTYTWSPARLPRCTSCHTPFSTFMRRLAAQSKANPSPQQIMTTHLVGHCLIPLDGKVQHTRLLHLFGGGRDDDEASLARISHTDSSRKRADAKRDGYVGGQGTGSDVCGGASPTASQTGAGVKKKDASSQQVVEGLRLNGETAPRSRKFWRAADASYIMQERAESTRLQDRKTRGSSGTAGPVHQRPQARPHTTRRSSLGIDVCDGVTHQS